MPVFGTWTLSLLVLVAHLHIACAGSVPIPERRKGVTETYVAVPEPPPPLRPEHVPPRPAGGPVWVDGEWDWDGTRYRWVRGGWVIPPPGAKIAPWAVARRDDGQLFYSPSVWYDANGRVMAAPEPIARGSVRGGDAGANVLRDLPDSGVEPDLGEPVAEPPR